MQAHKTTNFTNHNLAECPWGSGREKALCHLWWGNEKNNCSNDWKEYLYESTDNSGNWDRGTCNQYSWAYGEMGFDYTKRDIETGRPLSLSSSLAPSSVMDKYY